MIGVYYYPLSLLTTFCTLGHVAGHINPPAANFFLKTYTSNFLLLYYFGRREGAVLGVALPVPQHPLKPLANLKY